MRAVFRTIKCSGRSDKITIVPIGDTHLGARNIDMPKLQELISWIAKTPKVYWIGLGDYLDAINFSDKRFNLKSTEDISELDDLVNHQVRKFTSLFKPIANKCLGMLDGNHEATIVSKYHVDPVANICMNLGIDRLGYSAMMRLYFCRKKNKDPNKRMSSKSVVIYAHHGHGAGRTVAGKLNVVLNKAKCFDADIFIIGHTHIKVNVDGERIYISQDRGKGEPFIYARKQLFAITGSFMKSLGDGFSPYSEVAGYDPVPTGFIKIMIDPFRQATLKVDGKWTKREEYPHIHMSV